MTGSLPIDNSQEVLSNSSHTILPENVCTQPEKKHYDKAKIYRHGYMIRILSSDKSTKLLYELIIDYRKERGQKSMITEEAFHDLTQFASDKFLKKNHDQKENPDAGGQPAC